MLEILVKYFLSVLFYRPLTNRAAHVYMYINQKCVFKNSNINNHNIIKMNDLTNSPLLRKAYSNKYKHQVLSYHKSSGGTLASTASYFGISDSLLSKWLKLPLFYFSTENMPGERTMHFRGAKTVDIINTGHENLRFTVTLTINANGDILPAFLIFKNLKKYKE